MKQRPIVTLVVMRAVELAPDAAPILRAAEALHRGDVLQLRLEPLAADKPTAIAQLRTALDAIRRALVDRHGLPGEIYLVADDERHGTPVAPFQRARFLLPHHAGGRASFLTPSRIDCPDLRVDERVFATAAPGQRLPHTVFHGFIITNPGEPRGTTFYYNTLALLAAAFRHRHGRGVADVAELARFSLGNLRRSRAGQPLHRSRYVTLGALLGSPELAHHVMPSGPRAESELWPEQYIQLPQLCDMVDCCPCGLCPKLGHRLLCHASMQTLGASWPAVRAAYEVGVVGERYDLLVGNNLTLLHGADSELRRTIQPLGLAIDQPDSDAYERWLAGQWRAWREPARAARERAA